MMGMTTDAAAVPMEKAKEIKRSPVSQWMTVPLYLLKFD